MLGVTLWLSSEFIIFIIISDINFECSCHDLLCIEVISQTSFVKKSYKKTTRPESRCTLKEQTCDIAAASHLVMKHDGGTPSTTCRGSDAGHGVAKKKKTPSSRVAVRGAEHSSCHNLLNESSLVLTQQHRSETKKSTDLPKDRHNAVQFRKNIGQDTKQCETQK